MARIRSILGDIEGSTGQLTFTKVNGQNILRQKVGSNSSNTPAQQAVRARFKLLSTLFKAMSSAVAAGFRKAGGLSSYNLFTRANYVNTTYDPNTMVATADYPALLISGGNVESLGVISALKVANSGDVTVTWPDNSNGGTALGGDMVTVLAVNTATGAAYSAVGVASRDESAATLTDARLVGVAPANVRVYAFARRADFSDASPASTDLAS
jgi:hypothetical protein